MEGTQMNKINIIEGISGIGKSVLADRLVLGSGHSKIATPFQSKADRNEHLFVGAHCGIWEMILSGLLPSSKIVFDSSYLSYLVYGLITCSYDKRLTDTLWELDERIADKQKELNIKMNILLADDFQKVAARNMMREGEPYWAITQESLKRAQGAFNSYSRISKCHYDYYTIKQADPLEEQLDGIANCLA